MWSLNKVEQHHCPLAGLGANKNEYGPSSLILFTDRRQDRCNNVYRIHWTHLFFFQHCTTKVRRFTKYTDTHVYIWYNHIICNKCRKVHCCNILVRIFYHFQWMSEAVCAALLRQMYKSNPIWQNTRQIACTEWASRLKIKLISCNFNAHICWWLSCSCNFNGK